MKVKILLIILILTAIFLRFYDLGVIPAGLLNDEANLGYDSYSLLNTAKDQWGNFLPLNNFIGFGDFQPPINRYLSIIPIFLFGLSEFSVRFTSALSGVLSVIALYYLVRKLFNEKFALFSSLIFTLMPWAVGLNRIGHESNIAILFLILALIFGFATKFGKSLYLSVFLLALTMYTYSAYILFAPLVLIIIFYFSYKKNIRLSGLIKPFILFLILISPIIFQKNAASVRFFQVGLTNNINSVGLINDLNTQRGQCLSSYNSVICKANNKAVLFVSVFIKNYLSHFSPNFLYTSGTSTQFSILPSRGLDYLFNFIPLIIGFAFLLKDVKKKRFNAILIILFLISPIPDSLTSDGNYVRASLMQPFIAIFTGLGYFYLIDLVIARYKKLRFVFPVLLTLLLLLSFTSFFIVYTTYFKNNNSLFSQYGYKELVTNIKGNENSYDRIYLSRHLNDAKHYIYYLFYTKYDPTLYQHKKDVSYTFESREWISIDRVGKIYFVPNLLTSKELEDLSDLRVLIISHPGDFPKDIKTVFVIKDKLGNVIFKAVKASDLLEYIKMQEVPIKE